MVEEYNKLNSLAKNASYLKLHLSSVKTEALISIISFNIFSMIAAFLFRLFIIFGYDSRAYFPLEGFPFKYMLTYIIYCSALILISYIISKSTPECFLDFIHKRINIKNLSKKISNRRNIQIDFDHIEFISLAFKKYEFSGMVTVKHRKEMHYVRNYDVQCKIKFQEVKEPLLLFTNESHRTTTTEPETDQFIPFQNKTYKIVNNLVNKLGYSGTIVKETEFSEDSNSDFLIGIITLPTFVLSLGILFI